MQSPLTFSLLDAGFLMKLPPGIMFASLSSLFDGMECILLVINVLRGRPLRISAPFGFLSFSPCVIWIWIHSPLFPKFWIPLSGMCWFLVLHHFLDGRFHFFLFLLLPFYACSSGSLSCMWALLYDLHPLGKICLVLY